MSTNIEQIEALFNRAIEFRPDERAAFLAGACGHDTMLVARVQALLQAHDADAGILSERPRVGAVPGQACEKPGDRIGHYKLLEQIGEGGCGTVYMAQQEEPVRRLVAFKVIKLGMDTRKVVARFEAERQALALMDHPNIAKVLDAGTTQTGRPFFVMELVRGIKITDYCQQHNLPISQRLDLVMQCCRAIQHAHQKGIIHRDVKPSNILVTTHDGVAVPKVIDFGIAKAIEGRLTDQTLFTAFEQFIGTPAYMSPEQAQLKGLDVDTRTDIYSLGVLLYELLTGTTPFDAKELLSVGLDEMRKTIREKEPLRPSTRLSLELDAADTAARRKQTEKRGPGGTNRELHADEVPPGGLVHTKELIHSLRGDLDWIVMKCLEKDRARRYETANGLAMDLQRHLKGEPVVARPPSNLYRFQKLVQRNKLVFCAAAAVAVALIVGIVGSTAEAIRARLAEREQIRLRGEADLARAGEAAQRATAEQHLYDALLGEARAKQLSGRAGQRFESLDAIAKAAAIRRTNELSDEAVAAFALTDLRESKQWHFSEHWLAEGMCFDDPFVLYACRTPAGILVRRVADDQQIAFLQLNDLPGLPNGLLLRRFDPRSRFLAASCFTKKGGWRCRVWDLTRDGALVLDKASLGTPSFSPDGRAIATLNPDSTISITEFDSGRDLKRFRVDGRPGLLHFNSNGKLLAGLEPGSSTVHVWEVALGQEITAIQSTGRLNCFAWSHDGTLIATGGENGSINLWDLESGRLRSHMEGHEARVTAMDFSHQGDLLASASWDTTLRLWDVGRGQQLLVYRTEDMDLHFSSDDRTLAYAISGETAKLLQVAQSTGCRRFVGDADLPKSWGSDFSPDGRLVATCTSGGIGLWDVLAGKQIGFIRAPDCRGVHFHLNGGLSLIGSTIGGIYQWPLQTRAIGGISHLRVEPPRVLLDQEPFRYSALDPSGSKIVASRDGPVPMIVDLADPGKVIRLTGHPGANSVAWDPNGCCIATGTWKGTGVELYDASTGQLLRELPVQSSALVAFSPDGEWLATANINGFRFWKTGSWELWPQSLPEDQVSEVNAMAFSPDGRLLATVHPINEIRIIKVPSCEVVATLRAPRLATLSWMSFSPDGTKLAVLERAGQLNVWDLRLLRHELSKLNLDWNFPPFPSGNNSLEPAPAALEVDDGPFSREELAQSIPSRDANTSTNLIDLTKYYNAPLTASWHSPKEDHNDLSELGLGVRRLGGIEFDLRGLIQIGMPAANRLSYPSHVYDIALQRRCRRLHFLHAAIFAADARFGDELGSYVFHYTDGRQVELPIIASKDMAEWWSQPNEQDMRARIIWTGTNPAAQRDGHTIRLFQTTWENPFPDVPIRHLDFTSDKPTPGQPFLVAITVEP